MLSLLCSDTEVVSWFQLVVLALVAAAAAAPAPQGSPAQNNQDVQLIRYETDNDGLGNYNFAYVLTIFQLRLIIK